MELMKVQKSYGDHQIFKDFSFGLKDLYVVGWGGAAHIGGQVDAEEALPAFSG